ncbi:MAG: hypothetical protein NT027_16360 [Proteobacteria bacterium]|nr:hypothetical protein [Pseudomonadota bacterium]
MIFAILFSQDFYERTDPSAAPQGDGGLANYNTNAMQRNLQLSQIKIHLRRQWYEYVQPKLSSCFEDILAHAMRYQLLEVSDSLIQTALPIIFRWQRYVTFLPQPVTP